MRMDLDKLKSAYENGIPIFAVGPEELFAIVVANHMNSFRRIFIMKLSEFRAIIWDKESNRRVELASAPHVSLLSQLKVAEVMKPHHTTLTKLQHKAAFKRLHKGAHTVCLQSSGRANGRVELWVERKDTTSPAPPEDDEDRANGFMCAAYYKQMEANGLLSK